MIFLIEYNRSQGRIVTFRDFDESQRREAEDSRLGIELDLNRKGIDHEVVLLEAASEEALRRTHRRYFENLRQILGDKSVRESACAEISGRPPFSALQTSELTLSRFRNNWCIDCACDVTP